MYPGGYSGNHFAESNLCELPGLPVAHPLAKLHVDVLIAIDDGSPEEGMADFLVRLKVVAASRTTKKEIYGVRLESEAEVDIVELLSDGVVCGSPNCTGVLVDLSGQEYKSGYHADCSEKLRDCADRLPVH